jgi:putative protease
MKLLVVPNKIEDLDNILNKNIEGVVLGIEDLSIYFNFTIKNNEISEVANKLKQKNKKLFLSANKIMHNKDLVILKEFLDIIKDITIEGLFISDLGAYNIISKEYPSIPIVMNQAHLITNSKTCNYWLNKGVKYAKLSVELTMDEINEIKKNTEILTINNVFGYIPMFNSPRKLLTNYFNYIKKDKESGSYYIYDEKRNARYIIDEKKQTVIFSNNVMNAVRERDQLNLDYGIINGYKISSEILLEAIDAFTDENTDRDILYIKLSEKLPNMDTGFLYKESIYKVREHE